MTASEKPLRSVWRRERGAPPVSDPPSEQIPARLVPEQAVPEPAVAEEPSSSILGFPAEVEPADSVFAARADGPAAGLGTPDSSPRLVFHRRVDGTGGLLLVLAGLAAGVSLALPWVDGDEATGSSLIHRALGVLGSGVGALVRSTLWQPFVVVFGGYALLLLGLLLFVPARTHRLVGVLAFVVAGAAAAGVLVPLANAGWSPGRFSSGMWFAVAVAGLGLLGALKAMLTGPRVSVRPPAAPMATTSGP